MKRRVACFTLIEMVLAVAVFTTAMILCGGILFVVQQSWNSLQRNNEQLALRLRLDRIVDLAFRNAVPFFWPDETGFSRPVFRGRNDSIRLAYLHRINGANESGIRFLELSCEKDRLLARYRQYPLLEQNEGESRTEAIAEAVQKISFQYAWRRQGEIVWVENWDEEQEQAYPAAIRLKIHLADGTELRYLRRTAGNSFNSSYGKWEGVNAAGQ